MQGGNAVKRSILILICLLCLCLHGCGTEDDVYVPTGDGLYREDLETEATEAPEETPEQELVAHLGDVPWLQMCGNCRKVQPMVEAVAQEGRLAGITAGGNL